VDRKIKKKPDFKKSIEIGLKDVFKDNPIVIDVKTGKKYGGKKLKK